MAKVYLEIDAKTKSAQKKITKFGRSATKTMDGVQNSMRGLKVVAGGVAAFFAARGIASGLGAITQAASIQEDAVNSLNTSLKLSGEYSEAASKDMQQYASDLQKTSVYGDELILSQLALTKAFGATNEQAKLLVTASAELAAATGKSLDEATRQVAKTLGGFGGELSEVNSKIKALTSDQLKAGDAARILIDMYGGSAASKINTYSGAMTQASGIFGDFQESLGELITKNPIVIEGIKKISEFISKMTDAVKANQEGLGKLITGGFKAMINSVPKLVGLVGKLALGYHALKAVSADTTAALLGFVKAIISFDLVKKVIDGLWNGLKSLFGMWLLGLKEVLGFMSKIPGVGSALEYVIGDIDGAMKGLEDTAAGLDVTSSITDGAVEGLDAMQGAAIEMRDSTVAAYEDIEAGIDAAQKKTQELADYMSKLDGSTVTVKGATSAAAPGKAWPAMFKSAAKDWLKMGKKWAESASGKVTKTLAGGMLSGAKGASAVIGAGVDAVLPGFGAIATQIMDLGPDGVKTMIEQFVEAMPDLITALADSMPVIVETLVDTLLLRGGLERIVKALVKAAPKIAFAIVTGMISALSGWTYTGGQSMAAGFASGDFTGIFDDLNLDVGAGLNLGPVVEGLDSINVVSHDILDALLSDDAPLGKMFDQMETWSANFFHGLGKKFNPMINNFGNALSGFFSKFTELFNKFGELWDGAFGNFFSDLSTVFHDFIDLFSPLMDDWIPAITGAFSEGISSAISVLRNMSWPQIAQAFQDGMAAITGAIGRALTPPEWLRKLKIPSPTWLNQLKIKTPDWLDKLKIKAPGSGGGGTAGNIVSKVSSALGFAQGGIVYAADGFVPRGTDTVPAMLTPGELVVPKSTTAALFDNMKNGGNDNAILSAILEALNQPLTTSASVELDGDTLADIMLKLSRQNARVAA